MQTTKKQLLLSLVLLTGFSAVATPSVPQRAPLPMPAAGVLSPDQTYLVDTSTTLLRGVGLEVAEALLGAGVTEVEGVDLQALKAKLETMNVILSVVPGTLWEDGKPVKALNYPGENLVVMWIKALRETPSKRAIRIFVLHEALGLMRKLGEESVDKGYAVSSQIELEYADRFDSKPYEHPAWQDPNAGVWRTDVMAYLLEKRATGLVCRTHDGYDASESNFFKAWLAGAEQNQFSLPVYVPVEKPYEALLRPAIEYHALLKGWWRNGRSAMPSAPELREALSYARFETQAKTGRVTLQFTGRKTATLVQESSGRVLEGSWALRSANAVEVRFGDARLGEKKWLLQFRVSGQAPLHRYSLVSGEGLEFVHRLESCESKRN